MDSAFHLSDDLLGDVDEPPDESDHTPRPAASLRNTPDFTKSCNQNAQKASLLTQALHASEDEDEYDDEDEDEEDELVMGASGMKRGPSTSSTWSHTSGASTADLTSDGGLTSPGTRTNSPSPPPPSNLTNFPFLDKPFEGDVHVRRANGEKVNLAQKPVAPTTENTVEAGLGRKRCITFACGRKDSSDAQPVTAPKPAETKVAEAPKRPCMLKFICPSKVSNEPKPPVSPKPRRGRMLSPPPPSKRQKTPSGQNRQHRDSDSTVRNESPRSYRKSAPLFRPQQSSRTPDVGKETKFQDYMTSGDDFDEWAEESTAYHRRITVNDTLAKENGLRKLGEEIEEEALEEEEELEEEENQDDEDEDEEDQDEEENHDDESDDGFQTDDEDGFAVSDDESDAGSEADWWAPSAKNIEHIRPTGQRTYSISSIGSVGSPPSGFGAHHQRRTKPVKIRSQAPDLPDSTDFVCGTLDEDRPLEEAYIQNIEQRRAAKHKVTPQDIDPTFPQSDPEMDEEDEDEEVAGSRTEESDHHQFMHGNPDWQDEGSVRGRPQFKNPFHQSPRLSPKRLHSPPPPMSRRSTLANRSPPPPRRKTSPAPFRRLFGGQSPRRLRSPPPFGRLRSPPPTRRTSYAMSPPSKIARHPVLAARTHAVTHTSSLPRPPSGFPLQMMAEAAARKEAAEQMTDDSGCITAKQHRNRLRTRGAIDIVKGLEKKRALRKEKTFAKQCRKQPRGEKKPLVPGRGAERMQKIGIGRHNAKKGVPEPIWGGGREEFVLSL